MVNRAYAELAGFDKAGHKSTGKERDFTLNDWGVKNYLVSTALMRTWKYLPPMLARDSITMIVCRGIVDGKPECKKAR